MAPLSKYRKSAKKPRYQTYSRKRAPLYPMVRRVMMTQAEKKFFDISDVNPVDGTSAATLFTTFNWSTLSFCNAIQQGTSANNRIGNRIFVRYVQFTVTYSCDQDQPQNGLTLRYHVFRNNDTNGGSASQSEVWGPTAGGPAQSLRNYTFTKKYTTLLDRQLNCVTAAISPTATGITTPCGVVQHYVPINRYVNYRTSGTNITLSDNIIDTDILLQMAVTVVNCCGAKVGMRVVFNDV